MPGKKIDIIEICSSAMWAVDQTLKTMANIEMNSMPVLRREEVFKLVVTSSQDTFTSIIEFQQAFTQEKPVKGGIVFYLSRSNVGNLFKGTLGLDMNSSEAEIKDVCGEFCNVMSGCFKREAFALGYEDIKLLSPKNYFSSINLDLDIKAICKYRFSFSKEEKALLIMDVFAEGSV